MSNDLMPQTFCIETLIRLFAQTFAESEQTILVKGDNEPLYQPRADTSAFHQVIFAHGFFASALHESAHWCIAGAQRRLLVDYGYWYEADGRSLAQQLEFAKVEAKPQALEWLFNKACGRRFHISLDNLEGEVGDDLPFKKAVYEAVQYYQRQGLPPRAIRWQQALAVHYHQPLAFADYDFQLEELIG